MLGKLSIVCAVAATLMFPEALSAQVGGTVIVPNPGPGVRGAAPERRSPPGPVWSLVVGLAVDGATVVLAVAAVAGRGGVT